MIRILNIDVKDITRHQLLEQLHEGVLVTPNLDHLVKLQKDKEFHDCYCEAEWIVCDSRILQMCSKLLPKSFPEAIPGSSFFPAFCNYHQNDPDCRIFLLGAREGVASKAMENINRKMGREMVVGAYSPSFGFESNTRENEEIRDMINRSGATVVLVGVGAPKQEKWIRAHRGEMPGVKIWMALGATIDFEAGNVSRAPQWTQKLGMEWLYRFMCEPKRLFKRYFVDDPAFFWYFMRQLCGTYRNPFG